MSVDCKITAAEGERLRHVVQGRIAATDEPGLVYTAILGAGVFVCLHDPVSAAGGVAHFLFPAGGAQGRDDMRFGASAISGLVAQLAALGAQPSRLVGCVYGGAKLHVGQRDLEQRNIAFTLAYLHQCGIDRITQGTGGDQVRRVRFCPTTGAHEEVFLTEGLPHETLAGFGAG
ncbi:chemotaxis protein CheD [Pseudorhodobacter sp. E13]|uniref:chemotaxis protein CheD n=1 Tax=Pseudorhodobacter sp. E13 TaxID=2487931 RepID=UPI000F8E5ADC|nr:chemotaxis protein CheD [Pseudorhodobacter sp. E13]RUS63305.1 chemotaxis protein CheD [Pseudorhodobacter sp. E13]